MKVCSRCNIEKEFNEFHKYCRSKDGYKSACKICLNSDAKEYFKHNKNKKSEYQKKWQSENKEKAKKIKYEWQVNNKEKAKKIKYEWWKNNKEKINKYYLLNFKKIKKRKSDYAKKNNFKINYWIYCRKALKLKCTPPWYEIQKEEIIAIYKKAQELTKSTGTLHHVDHIYPLKPRKEIDPIGLHVLANLQILTEKENLRKNNMQPEEWEKYKL